MGEVYSIGFDLSALEKAFKMSEKIKMNLGAFQDLSKNNQGLLKLGKAFKDLDKNQSVKKMDKAFDGFNKDLEKGNKALKEQNKLLDKSYQKMNLMRMVGSKLKAGFLGLGGLAAGGIAGLLGGAVNGYKGTLSTQLRAKNVGLDIRQHDALAYAGKMTGLGEESLISSIEGLTTSLQDYSKWGNFASLGLNASDLQSKNPVEALFEVLDSMKDSDLPQYLKKQIIDEIGIPFDNFKFVLKEGTGEIEKYFKEGFKLNTYTEKDKTTGKDKDITGKVNSGLIKGERAGITFAENFAGVMKKISFDIAPAYIEGLETVTPLLSTFGETLSKGITSVIDFFTAFASAEDKGAFLKEKGGELLTSAGGALKGVWDGVTDYLKGKWDEVVQFFKDKWDEVVKSITGKFQEIATNIKIALSPITDIFKYANPFGEKPKNWLGKSYITDPKESMYTKMWNESKKDYSLITKQGEFYDPAVHTQDQLRVNDAIITKTGQVVKTDPQDYIFAMKQPQRLASSASGGGTYTININANVRSDNDIRQIKNELERLIKSFNSKR